MIEYALKGSRRYWSWVGALVALIIVGFLFYLQQLKFGLSVTGMSRDVSWGFYIAQFTFLVGVAASAVMVVLPYYLHNYKQFGRITILGEFLAIGSVIMCIGFIFVDLGQPMRIMNVMLYPTTNSVMFYDMIVLSGYLLLNAVIGWTVLTSEYKGTSYPKWVKPIILLSIPWAVSIHTVTAFLYSGLASRHFWHTAILAPRFLASAFAAGPALLIILCLIVRKFTKFDPGKEAIQKLAQIVTYAMIINVFFVLLEVFTAFYGQIPEAMHSLQFLFAGSHGLNYMVPWMWTATILAFGGIGILLFPKLRRNETYLAIACVMVFVAAWIDKGLGLMIGGFTPSPLGEYTPYAPTFTEIMITLMVYGIGMLVITVLYKIAVSVKEANEE
jgi:molybdopterin-containing oxidoreductase family membrane subunit